MASPYFPVSSNVTAETAELEQDIVRMEMALASNPRATHPKHPDRVRLANARARLKYLKVGGSNPALTPAPEPAPNFASANIDIGRFGIEALKIVG